MIAILLAISQNGAIGKENRLPWRIPEDLRYFKKLTTGKNVVMGRRTFMSIGRALPDRENYILTHDQSFQAQGVHVINHIEDIVAIPGDVFVIGGASLVKQVLQMADMLYLTELHTNVEGDTFLDIDFTEWELIWSTPGNPQKFATFKYDFNVYIRKNPQIRTQ